MDDIRASLERVRERVARAAERAGRRAEEVLLIGVSKTVALARIRDRKSTRLNSSHDQISYAVFCLKKKKKRVRSKEHTSELQSRSYLVCHLLLEKKSILRLTTRHPQKFIDESSTLVSVYAAARSSRSRP